ncbi:MAG TPA: DUF3857 domain-containing protein [Planctomycetota bacterium]|nr:DUF3857 domain-containing protein [Planctomycetota bacterium]
MRKLSTTLAALVLPILLSTTTAAPLADSAREAERHYLEGRSFEAAAAYRQVLEQFAALSNAEKEGDIAEAELALRRFSELVGETGVSRGDVELLEKLARGAPRSGEGSPALQLFCGRARHHLGWSLLDAGGKPADAREIWRPLGFLQFWRVVGPFDNERGSSFMTELEPEKEVRLDAQYDGKKRPIRWRPVPYEPLAGTVDLAAIWEPNEECLGYAWTAVESKTDADVALRLGTDKGFRVWVNGALVASRDIRRSLGFDQDAVGIRLKAGWNAILIKLAQATGGWRFQARLTGLDGSPLDGVTEKFPPADAQLPKATEAAEVKPGAGVEAALQAAIEARPNEARLHYLLGAILLDQGAHDETEHPDTDALTRAVQLDEKQAVARLLLAFSRQRDTTIAAQKEDNAWRSDLEKAADLGSALANQLLADYYWSTFGNALRARGYVEAALERNPNFGEARMLQARLAEAAGVPAATEQERAAVAKLPSATVDQRRDAALHQVADGKLDDATAIYEKILTTSAASTEGKIHESFAGIELARGRPEAARKMVDAWAALNPERIEPESFWSRAALGLDRLDEAIASLERALVLRPEDPGLHEEKAKLLLRAGRKEDAMGSLERALALQPNLPDVRDYLEFLRAAKSTFEDEFRRDVTEVIQKARESFAAKNAAEAGGDPAKVLLSLTAIHVNKDGTTKTYSQQVVQVLNDLGVRMYDRYSTYYARGEEILEFKKARVTRVDGTTADAKLGRFGGSSGDGGYAAAAVDLPSVYPGDCVEVEFVREDLAQSYFGDYFGHREIFQESLAIDEKALTLRVPAEREFHFHRRNLDLEPETTRNEANGTVTYVWTKKNIPKLNPEPGMPGSEEVSPVLEVSTFANWDAFNKWYWNLIKKQFESSPEIQKKVQELTSGASSDLDKIREIYNFVVTDIQYNAWEFGVHGFKPYNAATIFARRFGDCKDKALLLCVMLKEVGIAARPVLIHADDRRGEEDLTLPMVNHFNHCIAYVPPTGGREGLFLDGTAQFHSYEEIPSMDRGARVLVVGEDAAHLEQVPWNSPDEMSLHEEDVVTIRPDLTGELRVRARASGDYGVYVRQEYEIAAERKTRLERLYGRRFAASKVIEESFSNLRNLGEPVSFTLEVEAPRFATQAPEGLSIRAAEDFFGTARFLMGLASLEQRTQDVLLGSPRASTLKTTYHLPEGVRVKSLPPAHDLQNRFGRLQVTYLEESPTKLVTVRVIEITQPRVALADYAEFREFAASVGRLEDEKIVLERS